MVLAAVRWRRFPGQDQLPWFAS